jgi:hypothetical protein
MKPPDRRPITTNPCQQYVASGEIAEESHAHAKETGHGGNGSRPITWLSAKLIRTSA